MFIVGVDIYKVYDTSRTNLGKEPALYISKGINRVDFNR